MRIRTLEKIEEVQQLDGLLCDYTSFVASALEASAGVSFDIDELLANTLNSLEKVMPPLGRTFVAERADAGIVGMVFLRPSGPDAMEIKRLYVVPDGRGSRAGRALVEATIATARRAGATALRLDTTRNLTSAIALYEDMGFVFRKPYRESDHFDDEVLASETVFMKKSL